MKNLSPQKEVVIVVFGDTVGEAGEVAQAGDVEPGAGGHLQHAAPRLVAQQLDLGGVEQVGVVVPRQVVVGAVRLLVQRQHLGKDDDLRQLGTARFCLRSPVVGQLTPQAPTRTGHCQNKRQDNPHDPPEEMRHLERRTMLLLLLLMVSVTRSQKLRLAFFLHRAHFFTHSTDYQLMQVRIARYFSALSVSASCSAHAHTQYLRAVFSPFAQASLQKKQGFAPFEVRTGGQT